MNFRIARAVSFAAAALSLLACNPGGEETQSTEEAVGVYDAMMCTLSEATLEDAPSTGTPEVAGGVEVASLDPLGGSHKCKEWECSVTISDKGDKKCTNCGVHKKKVTGNPISHDQQDACTKSLPNCDKSKCNCKYGGRCNKQ